MKRALYLSQTGLTEPLGRSQVIPYLAGLSRRGWEISVLSLEPEATSPDERDHVAQLLAGFGIEYHPGVRSRSASRKTKALEMSGVLARATALCARSRPDIIHARSDLAAMVAITLARLFRSRAIYDCRGLLADEYVDAGYWAKTSFNYRALRRVERQLFAHADAVVTLTERVHRYLVEEERWVPPTRPFAVVPCCTDVERYVTASPMRDRERERIGAGDRFVLVYAGTLGSWYCEEEMARLFSVIAQKRPALFAVYTRADATRLRVALERAGVSPDAIRIESRTPDEMPAALAAGDAAVCFIRPCFSKIASSPTKVGEYLAAGLPVVMNRGIGDADAQLDATPELVDAGDFSNDALERCANTLCELADHPRPAAMQSVARRLFDVEQVGVARYAALYDELGATT